jgi:hypothetical protein
MTAVDALDAQWQRCPACGQPIEQPAPPQCPLCDYQFADDRVTHADATPYAQAYACRTSGICNMSQWVWCAGPGRLNHLALMRASAASRRFAWVYGLLLCAAAGLFQSTQVGWQWVTSATANPTKPAGEGWFMIAKPSMANLDDRMTVLWWNPAQGLIVFVAAGLAALIALVVLMALLRWGVRLAHTAPYRGEQRMSAASPETAFWRRLISSGPARASRR